MVVHTQARLQNILFVIGQAFYSQIKTETQKRSGNYLFTKKFFSTRWTPTRMQSCGLIQASLKRVCVGSLHRFVFIKVNSVVASRKKKKLRRKNSPQGRHRRRGLFRDAESFVLRENSHMRWKSRRAGHECLHDRRKRVQ